MKQQHARIADATTDFVRIRQGAFNIHLAALHGWMFYSNYPLPIFAGANYSKPKGSCDVQAWGARLEALYAKGPKLVSMEPSDGAQDVDPTIVVIRFVFDRPMKSGMALIRSDGTFPEGAGKPTWDVEGRVLTFTVRLTPGTAYRFGLNAEDMYGFQDRDGSPLRPIVVIFRTR
jgi:hypothetical protein